MIHWHSSFVTTSFLSRFNKLFSFRTLYWKFSLWTVPIKEICRGLLRFQTVIRVVKRFKELDLNEVYDLWHSAQLIGGRLEQYYHVQAMTYCVQDGEAAGQTVPHVHVHVIPRRAGDFERNDQVYEMLEASSSYLHGSRKWEIDTEERRVRTEEEMEEETKLLRTLFIGRYNTICVVVAIF
ncbi:Bis(5'-adenosyl)-triphosphatase [Galdieria sulphuraria]|nr:Bis(5'-adenosyl)-triphosphatase [Galdieria sulphuraria]